MAKGLVLNIDTTKSEFQNPMVELRQGDGNYQSLTVTVTSNGEPLDLTGWTTAFMGTTAGNHKIVDANVQVDNTQQGVFTYTPTKAWGQDIGEFSKAYFKFSKDDEAASGANFRVKVFEAVDLTEEEAGNYISVVDVMIDKIKTDMDTKLKDTQVTLNATQNQATIVQGNVDALNTNVNTLKAQNNNIRTADNTWTGNNIFQNLLTGRFATRILDVNDLLLITQSMNKYSGNWLVLNNPTLNTPLGSSSYFTITIVQGTDDSGYIIYQPLGDSGRYYSSVSGGKFLNWHKIANDETVVHNSGNETINGVKTFGSNIVQPKSTATVNFQNGFTTASVPLMLTRVGNIVSLTGRMIPNTSLNKDAITTAFTIPQGFKPANQFGTRQAGAYGYSYLGEFYPDGHFEFSAYSNNGTYVQPSNNEIHVNATWLTFD